MNKYKIAIIILLFIALCINVFGQNDTYPFEVVKTGNGKQSIVFIPGFASSGDVWNETISLFDQKFTCYKLTMAGFAGVKPQDNPSFKNWEKKIADYIKDNKIEKPILVGHSMGGGLAMAIAADYSELIDKIVVVDALPFLSALMNPSAAAKQNNDCSAIVNQVTSMPDNQFLQMQQMAIKQLLENTKMQETVINWSVKSDRNTFARMFCDFSNTDLRERITSIQCPSLILLEANFKNIKETIGSQFKNLKTAQLEYANSGLHFIMFDDKDWYNTQLTKFISIK